jgi:hypothetical protein
LIQIKDLWMAEISYAHGSSRQLSYGEPLWVLYAETYQTASTLNVGPGI